MKGCRTSFNCPIFYFSVEMESKVILLLVLTIFLLAESTTGACMQTAESFTIMWEFFIGDKFPRS